MPSPVTGAALPAAVDHPDPIVGAASPDLTRERIVRAASRLFSEQGYAATSVKQIATAVRVSAPALYWHFASKGDLLHAVIQSTLSRFLEAATTAIHDAGGDPRAQLTALVRMYAGVQLREVDDVSAYSSLYAQGSLFKSLPEESYDELRALEVEVFNTIRLTVRRGIELGVFAAPSATMAAHAIVGVVEHLPSWAERKSDENDEWLIASQLEIAERIVGVRHDVQLPE